MPRIYSATGSPTHLRGGADDRSPSLSTAPRRQLPMDAPAVKTVLVFARVLLALLLIVVAVRWHWEAAGAGRVAVFGLACAMSLCLSPVTWRHHLVMFLPGMLFLPWVISESYRSVARWLAILGSTLVLGQYITRGFAGNITGRLGLLGIGIAIWCIVAGIYLLRMKQLHMPNSRTDVSV
jgi:hypothetical protein